jgi:hypothetical protein
LLARAALYRRHGRRVGEVKSLVLNFTCIVLLFTA